MKVNTQFTISLKCSQWAGPQNYVLCRYHWCRHSLWHI